MTVTTTLTPHQLTVMTTSTCNARCAHCSVSAGPERDETLTPEAIVAAVEAVHALHPLRVVVFAGGEPTLLGEGLLDVIAHLDCRGIATRIVTNASWASTEAEARATIVDLREAGLCELNVSADDFHLPFIPLANVVNAWRASKGAGFKSVVIALCSGPLSRLTPEVMMAAIGERPALVYDELGAQQPLGPPAADGTRYAIANNHVYRIGRGRKLRSGFASYPDAQGELDMPCPWAVRSAAVSPRGHLVACCGIEAEGNEVLDFGDLETASAGELVERANEDPLVAAIAELGPMYVMRRAAEADPTLPFAPRYSAICEVCEAVVGNPRAVAAVRGRAAQLRADVAAMRVARAVAGAAAPPPAAADAVR